MLFTGFTATATYTEPAHSAPACLAGEHLDLIDPVIEVIEGPGDATEELERWSNLSFSYFEGPRELHLNNEGFELQRVK
ncbi:hypothetical protein [Enhygromyxa salina]|uniref:hypothetical protein n=1 Tax=Enhygromyxa salina TaxID=215803 RepID=UPI0015E66E1F|nr:hypothetical protein [Enhygromyxa salina]